MTSSETPTANFRTAPKAEGRPTEYLCPEHTGDLDTQPMEGDGYSVASPAQSTKTDTPLNLRVPHNFECTCDPSNSPHERVVRGTLKNMRDDVYLYDRIPLETDHRA